jgi:RNA polymerase sigma-70 factor (ECF subfamily)
MLESTEESVTSALKRARAALPRSTPDTTDKAAEQELVRKLTHAFESSDVDGLVALLTDDVWLTMPPIPLEYQGRELAARFHATVTFRHGRVLRLVPTRANGQPALGLYASDPNASVYRATGLLVITLAGPRISAMTCFDRSVLSRFGLPRILP